MNRNRRRASETKDGRTIYQYRAREGSGVNEFVFLWKHGKHTFEAAALFENEPTEPEFAFTRIVSTGADDDHEAQILPGNAKYEPDRRLDVIAMFADIPTGLRAALTQDRNRAKLARWLIACTPDEDRRRALEQQHRYSAARYSQMDANPKTTCDALYAQRHRVIGAAERLRNASAHHCTRFNPDNIPF